MKITIYYYIRLTAICPGLPGWAGTRKVKPIWINLLKQEAVSGSGISWGRMQICTSLQTNNHASTSPLVFTVRCYASAVLAMGLCLSVRVRLSQVGVLLKRLNGGSHKQHHTIPQRL